MYRIIAYYPLVFRGREEFGGEIDSMRSVVVFVDYSFER